MKSEITYIAIPYTFNPELSNAIACEVTANLISQGKVVISVVNQYHNVANYLPKEQRNSNAFWMSVDLPLLRICSELLVVVIGSKGHELIAKSDGCRDEIAEAMINNIPINYYQYDYEFK